MLKGNCSNSHTSAHLVCLELFDGVSCHIGAVARQQLLHILLLPAEVCCYLLLQLPALLAHRLLSSLQGLNLLGGLDLTTQQRQQHQQQQHQHASGGAREIAAAQSTNATFTAAQQLVTTAFLQLKPRDPLPSEWTLP